MNWLAIFRIFTLVFTILCGGIVLALGSDITALSEKWFAVYYNFSVLSIATGVLAVLPSLVMIIIGLLRKGAFTSSTVFELSWLSILWVLFIATAGLTLDQTSAVFSSCNFVNDIIQQVCRETQAIEAFSFLGWIVLLCYTVTLLVVALINHSRGAPVWMESAAERGSVLSPSPTSAPAPPPASAPQFQPPMQQYAPQPGFAPQVVGQEPPQRYGQPIQAQYGQYPQHQHQHQSSPSVTSMPQPQVPGSPYSAPSTTSGGVPAYPQPQ